MRCPSFNRPSGSVGKMSPVAGGEPIRPGERSVKKSLVLASNSESLLTNVRPDPIAYPLRGHVS